MSASQRADRGEAGLEEAGHGGAGRGGESSQVGVVLAAVFLAYLGQTTLNPVIAPLSREVGLDEWQIGFTISVAAVMVVLTSQIWGRHSQSWGRKPVLVAALAICTAAMVLFAIVAAMGVNGALSQTPLFILFVLIRGMLFGTALAAILPTAQAYIADITSSEEERVRGMAGVGASQWSEWFFSDSGDPVFWWRDRMGLCRE